jgi:HEAT repeat protein
MENTGVLWDGQPLEYWLRTLHDPDDEARWRAIDALRHIAHPSQTIALFTVALNDRYWRARALAAHALYDLAHEDEMVPLLLQAVIPLANALLDVSTDVGLNAAYTLELLGSTAAAALPQLREAAKLGDDQLRKAASDAISNIIEPRAIRIPELG